LCIDIEPKIKVTMVAAERNLKECWFTLLSSR
jgi:hypothetical protein